VGRRTGHTDEGSSLHLLGSGFIDRDRHHTVEDAVRAECHEETRYRSDPFPAENALALALVFGSNHDTGVTVHLPLPVDSHEVDLKGDEHSDLLLLPKRAIPFVLHNGKMKGIRCVDQMIGSLEAYFLYVRQG
ncbi:MAG TPA: hypothetical protein VJK52_05210, partial [Candidatus Nanoarchaeia archaeon]|nr:hypothetical protein [Candidatus Nanoarchaeia archaeon]